MSKTKLIYFLLNSFANAPVLNNILYVKSSITKSYSPINSYILGLNPSLNLFNPEYGLVGVKSPVRPFKSIKS